MRGLFVCTLLIATVASGCATSAPSGALPSEPGSDAPPSEVAATPTNEPTPSVAPTPQASESLEPPELFGTWRTTLGGEPLSLNLTESTYRIVRGANSATGEVAVADDQIEFFNSSLCAGTGVYRWAITDGALAFFPIETEPCPGRAEALLVRYTDYSPPSGG